MTIQTAAFVWQLSSGLGTGNLLIVDHDAYVQFAPAFGTGIGNKFYYGIKNRSLIEWETGEGYMLDADTLVRETVIASSNANALVDFSAGIKDVICDVPANFQTLVGNLGTMANEDADDYYTKIQADLVFSEEGHTHITAEVLVPSIVGSTYGTLEDFINTTISPGLISGGEITVAGVGLVNVSAGKGLIRIADDDVSQIKFFDFPAAVGIAIPADDIRYIGVEYNAGFPQVISKIADDWGFDMEFPLGTALQENSNVYVINRPWKTGDSTTNIIERLDSDAYITRDNRVGGLILGETGTRNITITEGQLMTRLEEFPISSNDTSGADTFVSYYRDGSGGWVLTSAQTQYGNSLYDDGSGTLAPLTADYYMSHWVYITVNNKILTLYGQAEFSTLAQLVEEDFPPGSVPIRVMDMSILLGRIVIKEGQSSSERIDTVFSSSFSPAIVSDHGSLSGLADDDHTQYLTTGRADTWLGTKSTTNLAEGTNLYFTDTRARTAAVINAIVDGVIDIAPSQNAVFDALALKSNVGHTHVAADVTDFSTATDARITLQKGAANGLATLGGDSKIPSAQLPAIAITDTFVVASQAAQTALTAETGDVAVRTDQNKSYVLRVNDPTIFANWQELLTPTDAVLSVNGFTGSVVLTTSDVAEGTNLYYTQGRFDTAFAAKSTTDLAEGTNLYFTDERVDDRVAALVQNGTGLTWTYVDGSNTFTGNVSLAPFSTTNLAEGTNLYYTQGRFDTAFAAKSTTDLAEGANLYFTDERVDDRVSSLIVAGGGIQTSYNDAGNALTFTASFGSQLLHVQDQKAQNTAGGTFTSGAWRTRDLNTSLTNEITGASLAANQITLPAGTYYCDWSAPAQDNGASTHQTRLQNITAATTLRIGQSCINGGSLTTFSRGGGRFTLGSSSVIELQHQISATQVTDGLGVAANFTTEVYSDIRIWKI